MKWKQIKELWPNQLPLWLQGDLGKCIEKGCSERAEIEQGRSVLYCTKHRFEAELSLAKRWDAATKGR